MPAFPIKSKIRLETGNQACLQFHLKENKMGFAFFLNLGIKQASVKISSSKCNCKIISMQKHLPAILYATFFKCKAKPALKIHSKANGKFLHSFMIWKSSI
jgi:hypothetical protein